MARARNIKPGFFTNELLGTADPMVCLTFAGLWCLADKHGILEDRPLRIKAELFPYRESLDVNGYLTVLSQLGFIQRYEVNGSRYIKVLHFRKHQSPHHTEKAKGYPEPDCAKPLISAGNRYDTVTSPCIDGEHKVPTRSDSLIPDSLILPPTEDASASVDATALLWRDGKKILVQLGMKDSAARSFIGKCLKQFTTDQVHAAILSAERAGTGDPAAYITRAISATSEPQRFWK